MLFIAIAVKFDCRVLLLQFLVKLLLRKHNMHYTMFKELLQRNEKLYLLYEIQIIKTILP